MTDLMPAIAAFFQREFHNEIALVNSLSSLGQVIYAFYALAAVLVIRPHIRQAMKYRDGNAGKGDFCTRAQYEAIFWRLAPLLYAFVINSKLLALSVFIDIVGRVWTIHESHRAEQRFVDGRQAMRQQQDDDLRDGLASSERPALVMECRSTNARSELVKQSHACTGIDAVVQGVSSSTARLFASHRGWRKAAIRRSVLWFGRRKATRDVLSSECHPLPSGSCAALGRQALPGHAAETISPVPKAWQGCVGLAYR